MTEPSYKDWYVGMKVVNIGDLHPFVAPDYPCPDVGEVYTISEIELLSKGRVVLQNGYDFDCCPSDMVMITLSELGPSAAFDASEFRPLVTRKTDISVFTEMLRGTRNKVSA